MIAYRIGILPLLIDLKQEIPDVNFPWYDDGDRALGTFARIETSFNSLIRQGPGRGYYPKLSKSVLIVHLGNLEAGKEFGERHVFKVLTGVRYLGGYIGYDESKSDWTRERTLTWEKKISTISKTAGKYPQES